MGEAGMGLACGTDAEMVENITRWCKEAAASAARVDLHSWLSVACDVLHSLRNSSNRLLV